MAKKFGLGAGLDALMGGSSEKEDLTAAAFTKPFEGQKTTVEEIKAVSENPVSAPEAKLPAGIEADENGQLWLDVEKLRPNPQQPRVDFDKEKLDELAESIKEHGILQAITVEDAGNGFFYIIAGERRTRAAKLAGLTKVPVQLRKFSDQKKLEVALIENIQRADLNPIEEAVAYYKLMEISGLNQEQVAQRVGKNRSTVANAIRLLKLPEDIRNALVQGTITPGHARAILSVNCDTDMRILFGKIVGSGMNVRQAESYAAELNGQNTAKKDKPAKKAEPRDPNLTEVERNFIERLGTKVQIKGSMEKGTLEIEYFSAADLTRLYDIICGE